MARVNTCKRGTLRSGLWATLALVVTSVAVTHAVRAATPALRYRLSADSVEDTRTRLIWQRALSPELAVADAKDYCSKLSIAGGGFRMPTLHELLSLLDPTTDPDTYELTAMLPARIDLEAFPGTPRTKPFWTSTPVVTPSCSTCPAFWVVLFNQGPSTTSSTTGYTRCVRSAPAPNKPALAK
jgi:hypothetical protein